MDLADLRLTERVVQAALEEGSNKRVEETPGLARAAASREQASAFGRLEETAGRVGRDLGRRGRELGRYDREEAAALDEVLGGSRHPADDFLGEVVVEIPLAAGKTPDDRPNLVAGTPPDHRLDEPERRRPALRRGRQVVEQVSLQWVPIGVAKQALRLVAVEAQVVRADLRGLSDRSQPGEWEGGPRSVTRSRPPGGPGRGPRARG